MRMFGLPYRITSTVTALKPGALIEWRHPFGHRWRWEFDGVSPTLTRVTETFDFRDTGAVKDGLNYYTPMGFAKSNAAGIEATLAKLRDRLLPRLSSAVTSARACRTSASPSGRPPERCDAVRRSAA
jgi:hypothetical protein